MDAFFGITLSIILITMWVKSITKEVNKDELNRNTVKAKWDRKRIKAEKLKDDAKLARKTQRELEIQKQKDAELISAILPTINTDK